jgi:pimeloyl-ACP methyl ester carboxylesterase
VDQRKIDSKNGAAFRQQVPQVLFVHGMGRSPLSGWPLLWCLKRAGLKTHTFGYAVTIDDFAEIVDRLVARMEQLARKGDYVVIGHSLGGVLLRAAITRLPANMSAPKHLFLLGSPIQASRLAQRLQSNLIFRALTRDCGQLLGSRQRMLEIGAVAIPVTVLAGIRGVPEKLGWFGREANDGIVSVSETCADWIGDRVELTLPHTLLPSSPRVADVILKRLGK